jgi:hypothetical protein
LIDILEHFGLWTFFSLPFSVVRADSVIDATLGFVYTDIVV